jgi:hypothetical protein
MYLIENRKIAPVSSRREEVSPMHPPVLPRKRLKIVCFEFNIGTIPLTPEWSFTVFNGVAVLNASIKFLDALPGIIVPLIEPCKGEIHLPVINEGQDAIKNVLPTNAGLNML